MYWILACTSVDPATTVFRGGRVYTLEEGAAPAEALAVRNGRIVAVGTEADLEAFVGPDTEVVDLTGGALLPGFVDAHCHLVWGGMDLLVADLWSAATMDELLAVVSAFAASHPDDAWVSGSGWDASSFEGQMHRSLLDSVVPDRPVFLYSADGHSAWVNTAALEAAGIDDDTADPAGGIIERDGSGVATGVLRESAIELVSGLVPLPDEAAIDGGLAEAAAQARGFGITTAIDANTDSDALEAYTRAGTALGIRVHGAIEADPTRNAGQIDALVVPAQSEYATELFVVDAVKLYLDGVLESGTGWLLEPYVDGTNGEQLFTDEKLDGIFAAADAAGLQLHVHAIGDAAVRQALDAVERLALTNGAADRRPLAAHIELIHPDDVPRFAELGVYANFQPLWAYPDAYITDLTVPVIGEERAEWLYPIGGVLAAGGTLVAGSDWNVSTNNPWEAIEVAVLRQDPEGGGDVLTPGQQIGLEAAIAAYTRDGARAVFAEDDLGTLTTGKLADLVVVDRDPFAIDAAELSDVTVIGTWLGGTRVYTDGEATAKRVGRRRH
jgi:predicted amidohydrolase YtcJ